MNIRLALATAALIAALPLHAAQAAPQILGLLADSAVPFHCEDGMCTAEVSAICLQQERDLPAWGTAYRATEPERLSLTGTRADGSAASMPIGEIADFESARGSWAVTIRVPEAAVRALGLTDAALTIEGRVALAPVPEPGDPLPQTAGEIAAAVTAFRKPHQSIVGDTAPGMAAAHVMNEMINTLPHVTLHPDKRGGDLWRKTFGSDAHDQPGMQQAATFYDICAQKLILVDPVTLRHCLRLGHDDFVTKVNVRYWDASKPGV
ncbi:MAG: hypothetical protein GKS00_29260 [Alphaproteobacteria bacterium]|nr:hypothetical protein [Alphaproteobacteria bacterium]